MDYTPQEVQLLTKTLPGIAAQLRGALANMHAALSSGDTPDACILRQSYYRLLRTVTNLTDASLLAEDFPLPKQDMDLVLFIDDLCVDQQARGQHIGERLFEHVKNEAKQKGCYEVTLNVWTGNISAEKFYEKMGMKTKEKQMEYIL